MSIKINSELCTGCGRCLEVCPGTLLWKDKNSNKALIRNPEECWGCTSCLKECAFGAISYYLGADMGGRGSTLKVHKRNRELVWQITDREGRQQEIVIDTTRANSY